MHKGESSAGVVSFVSVCLDSDKHTFCLFDQISRSKGQKMSK